MPRVTLNLPDLPPNWEYTGEYRSPVVDDYVLIGGIPTLVHVSSPHPMPIVRKPFEWPGWVKPGTWYAKDADGTEWLFTKEPQLGCTCWVGRDDSELTKIRRTMLDFPVQQCCNWEKSLRQKPLNQ